MPSRAGPQCPRSRPSADHLARFRNTEPATERPVMRIWRASGRAGSGHRRRGLRSGYRRTVVPGDVLKNSHAALSPRLPSRYVGRWLTPRHGENTRRAAIWAPAGRGLWGSGRTRTVILPGLARGRAWREPDQRSVVRHRFLGSGAVPVECYSLLSSWAGFARAADSPGSAAMATASPSAIGISTANHGRGMSGTGTMPRWRAKISHAPRPDTAPAGDADCQRGSGERGRLPRRGAADLAAGESEGAKDGEVAAAAPHRGDEQVRDGRQREAAERNAQQHRQVPHSAEVDQVRRRRWFLDGVRARPGHP